MPTTTLTLIDTARDVDLFTTHSEEEAIAFRSLHRELKRLNGDKGTADAIARGWIYGTAPQRPVYLIERDAGLFWFTLCEAILGDDQDFDIALDR